MIKNSKYAVLHAHDTFGSIGDSILRLEDYISKSKELGLTDLALTNHGSMSTFVTFYEECKKKEINPIIGCEIYFCDDALIHDKTNKEYYHLILLAKNYNGLKNLITIHNEAYKSGFYYKPRTDLDILSKYNQDLICLSACLASPISKSYFNKDLLKASKYVSKLKDIFGSDFYLEIQPGNFTQQIQYNDFLVSVSELYNIPLVATNDIHYLDQDMYKIHDLHIKDARKIYESEDMIYPDKIYYLMSREELNKTFVRTQYLNDNIIDAAIEETNKIAAKCNIVIPDNHIMPQYSSLINEDAVLKILCYKELKNKNFGAYYSKYQSRLDHELDVIKQLGFSGYFLIVKDMIDFCDQNNIARGPGRGSAAGSLVSYLLKISIADPIKYNLMFERFLSIHRKSYPDIDLDIDSDKRQLLYQHIIEKYGSDRCCFVSTYNIRKARNSIKAAARLLGYEMEISNEISKLIPYSLYDELGDKHSNLSISEAYNTVPEFKKIADKYPQIIETAKNLEGYPSSMGIHPAGIVISAVSVSDKYPLVKCNNDLLMATSLDLKDVEKMSGIKFDLLALSSLSVVHKTMKMVGIKFDYSNEDLLTDQAVWNLISSNNTTGLFQISSYTYKSRMPLLKPKTIQELAACLALVRGPCISSGADKKYIDILNKKAKPKKIHDLYWEATKDTYGIVIYQEQILKICMNIGFDSETAYNILKAVSKKKIDKINLFKNKFYDLANKKELEKSIIDCIWNEILNAGLYAFNIAHATSYALLCYCSAYLKQYYPLEYMSNLLTKEYANTQNEDNINKAIAECERLQIQFQAPDINDSDWEFKIKNERILLGFCSIKGVGRKAYDFIRSNGVVKNFNDFIQKNSGKTINKKIIILLILAGTFKNIEPNKSVMELLKYYMTDIRKEKDWNGTVKIGAKNFNINSTELTVLSQKIYNVSCYKTKGEKT